MSFGDSRQTRAGRRLLHLIPETPWENSVNESRSLGFVLWLCLSLEPVECIGMRWAWARPREGDSGFSPRMGTRTTLTRRDKYAKGKNGMERREMPVSQLAAASSCGIVLCQRSHPSCHCHGGWFGSVLLSSSGPAYSITRYFPCSCCHSQIVASIFALNSSSVDGVLATAVSNRATWSPWFGCYGI